MLSVLYCVYLRKDESGEESGLDDSEQAVNRWKALWDRGTFDMDAIGDYLESWRDRFYLFDGRHPFYQANIEKGTEYLAAKLNGAISESNNKARLFSPMTGESKARMSYAEAARWLLYLNAFDDTSSKPSVRGADMPSPGAGWLGKLGIVYLEGSNLFETLMLNMVMVGEDGMPFRDGTAVWERDTPDCSERVEIPFPDNPVELLTLQSRRIRLNREGTAVTGYLLLGGDVVQKEDALLEQMTMWRYSKEGRWVPRRHDPSRSLWRDFQSLLIRSDDEGSRSRKPGVIRWMSELVDRSIVGFTEVNVHAVSVKFADKDFFVEDLVSDGISVNASLLTSLGVSWNVRIGEGVSRSDKAVAILGRFAGDVARVNGMDDKDVSQRAASARAMAYGAIDQPFRSWLSSIDPRTDDMDVRMNEWDDTLYDIISGLGRDILEGSGMRAMVGRHAGDKDSGQKGSTDILGENAFTSHRRFRSSLYRLLKEADNEQD